MNINEQEGRATRGCVVYMLEPEGKIGVTEGCARPPVNHFTVPPNAPGQRSELELALCG